MRAFEAAQAEIDRLKAEKAELLTALKTARHVLICGTTPPYIRQVFNVIEPAITKAEATL